MKRNLALCSRLPLFDALGSELSSRSLSVFHHHTVYQTPHESDTTGVVSLNYHDADFQAEAKRLVESAYPFTSVAQIAVGPSQEKFFRPNIRHFFGRGQVR